MMLESYIGERYPGLGDPKELAKAYAMKAELKGVKFVNTDGGMVSYRFEGDAIVLMDMYVKPSKRHQGHAWSLFNELIKAAKAADKRVIITSSEVAGKNQELGLGAIKAAGFELLFSTPYAAYFLRGVY